MKSIVDALMNISILNVTFYIRVCMNCLICWSLKGKAQTLKRSFEFYATFKC